MCFSATASFSAGAVLTVIGIVSLKKVQHRSQLPFASIPLIFAAQQIAEGVLWLALPGTDTYHIDKLVTYFFLVFAQVLWPVWIPMAVLLLEKHQTRRFFQKILVGIGLMVSVYLGYCMIRYRVSAEISCYHIEYHQFYPETFRVVGGVMYIMATILPPLFSHLKKMWILSVTVMVSYLITASFYENYIVSVWCFFASVVSLSIYVVMLEIHQDKA
ncbi:DUF6629 family protein [Pedobacter sp. ASV28]|uniref:DUF6629 family protein n=1 Tax=Pedobacter sp. ASV28 TaxID=2795123 RepID=UPI0018ED2517|nr:DUF6629 family protein [Pedobacter sp. ASV28]